MALRVQIFALLLIYQSRGIRVQLAVHASSFNLHHVAVGVLASPKPDLVVNRELPVNFNLLLDEALVERYIIIVLIDGVL